MTDNGKRQRLRDLDPSRIHIELDEEEFHFGEWLTGRVVSGYTGASAGGLDVRLTRRLLTDEAISSIQRSGRTKSLSQVKVPESHENQKRIRHGRRQFLPHPKSVLCPRTEPLTRVGGARRTQ